MAIQVGILGLGMMGKCHFDTYNKLKGVKIVAVCDVDEKKRRGNIGPFGTLDLSKVKVYSRAEDLINDPQVDVVDITLPTPAHAPMTIKAFQAGKHVICEKPMARTAKEAKEMIDAAKKYKRHLYIAHCLRFWPSYVKAKELIESGKYGKVLTARFNRISPLPTWSWKNWLQTASQSGRCALDLHIHDADFIRYLFGKPKMVQSMGVSLAPGGIDHIVTTYIYPERQWVIAEGAWEYSNTYPFSMTFTIALEMGTLEMNRNLALTYYPNRGKPKSIKVLKGDGYEGELRHFLECIQNDRESDIIPPEDAYKTMLLIEAELESIKTQKPVLVRA